jgi:nitrate/TMAO reductase-like tetraheme cytochrome c subunit
MLLKQCLSIIAIAVLVMGVTACERTVTNTVVESTAQDCFSCHSDVNTRLVSAELQWDNSIHASGHNVDVGQRVFFSCNECHTSEGWIAKIAGGGQSRLPNPTVIHCFTCHAPHTNGTLELRVTANSSVSLQDGTPVDLNTGKICVTCHQSRRNVNTYVEEPTELSEHWGPHHSPQGDMLMGSNGYEYGSYTYRDFGAHRMVISPADQDGDGNPDSSQNDGCLECHFKFTSKNRVGGHSFNVHFDVEGEELYNTPPCNACHSGPDLDESFDYMMVQTTTDSLIDTLAVLLETAGLIDPSGHPLDDVFTSQDSAGAVWNYLIAHEDRSEGVHNAWYIEDLLESAIRFISTGQPPVPAAQPNIPVAARKPDNAASTP